jgi:hypothetical protein|nr:MAG TPA: hypothetical protein [Caudoviricetes sp.]
MIEQSVSLASNGTAKLPGYEQLVRFGYTKNRGVYRLHVDATGEWEGLTVRAFWHVPGGKDPVSSLVADDGYVDVPASVTAQPGNGCITFEGSDGTKTVTSADLHYRVSANSGTEDGTEPEPGTPAWQQLVDAVHTDATAAEQAKTDAQTAAQQAGASAKKAGQALSDTITAKEDALKAIGDKQTAATQAVDTARDKALKQVEASTKAAQTAASEAATSAGNASQSAQEAADSLQELKDGIANGDFKGEKGDPGPAVALDTTLTHEGEAADAKATGDAISAVKARQNILTGTETGNPISVDDAFPAPLCGLTVYGKSTQDGTPTPDAPVPIVSAGDGGSITVTLSDGNGKTQTLTLPTPNGLPGIPVTSGGNYTDSTGQQWVCDEVDLERGVKVQRIYEVDVDGENVKFEQADVYANLAPKGIPIALVSGGEGARAISTFTSLPWFYNKASQFLYLIAANISDQLNESCKKQLGKIYYALATPIETPLTPDEIAAYKALTAYGPDTVVQASDGAGVKLDYQRDVNLVVKNFEDAIASMTTT